VENNDKRERKSRKFFKKMTGKMVAGEKKIIHCNVQINGRYGHA
jgi:hypothetical protein